jgi:hypothetical protein
VEQTESIRLWKEDETKALERLRRNLGDQIRRLRFQAELTPSTIPAGRESCWSLLGWDSTDSARIEREIWIDGQSRKALIFPKSLSAEGVIGYLQARPTKFDPRCIVRQSTNDVFGLIDPDSNDVYGSSNSGSAWIEFEFREPIPISTVQIGTAGNAYPRSFDIRLKESEVKSVRKRIQDAQELNGANRSRTYSFASQTPERLIKSVKIEQTSPNWQGTQYFNIGSIEFFSASARFSSGVFRTLFAEHREEIRKFVRVTAKDFGTSQIHSILTKTIVCTFPGPREWIEIDLVSSQLLLNAYRLKRNTDSRLRSWSLLGSNDRTLHIDEWTVIDSKHESKEGEYELCRGFDCASGAFRFFRLVQDGQQWGGSTSLVCRHIELFGCLLPLAP